MKISASKLISEMKKIEGLLDSNFDATGSNLRDKILTATKQMPKGIVEKLTYLAGLYERAQAGEKLSSDELRQAGYWINAVYPYITNGAQIRANWGSKLVWLVLAAAACFAAFYFLRR